MKKISKIIVMAITAIVLISCSRKNPEELTDFILSPKKENPILMGTWQVTNVDKSDKSTTSPPVIGDRLYVSNKLVAINEEYAFPPSFTAKYVNLSEYLVNRGFEFDNVDLDQSVIVINASEGQYFARDFIKISEDEIFYIVDDNIVYLSKLSNDVDSNIIKKYTTLANNERIKPAVSEKSIEDISILLGVRERIDLSNGRQDYKYYTYLIRILDDGNVKYKKTEDIFVRGLDEYLKVRSSKNSLSGFYDNIEAFPIRLESQMDDQSLIDRYQFRDFDMNIKLTFVDKDYISFSYTRNLFDNTINKYGFISTNELLDNRLITLEEFTGENDATEQFENMIENEILNKVSDVDPKDLIIDSTNFGLVRDTGTWSIETSIYTKDSQIRTSTQVPIRNYVEEKSLANPSITRDQVRNINSQFKDFHILNNGKFIIIQTQDEILIHKITDDLIEKKPFFSIATPNPTAFVSIDQQSGSNAKTLDQAFTNSNKIIDSN